MQTGHITNIGKFWPNKLAVNSSDDGNFYGFIKDFSENTYHFERLTNVKEICQILRASTFSGLQKVAATAPAHLCFVAFNV